MGTLKELLAKPDAIRITAPLLPRETMDRVLQLIRKDVAEDNVRIDTPTQNLESYFLGVVQKAKQSEAETSGATSGNRVAAYLRGEAEARPASISRDKILERLTLPSGSGDAAAAPEPTPVETVDHKKLDQLTRSEEVAGAEPKIKAAPTAEAELRKANVKLAGLVNKKE